MQVIYTSEHDFIFNGRELTAQVEIAVGEDDLDPRGDFDSGDTAEDAEYLARFESGELFMAVLHVTATFGDFQGDDYLGACHLTAGDIDGAVNLALEYSMTSNAVDDLIRKMTEALNQLTGT